MNKSPITGGKLTVKSEMKKSRIGGVEFEHLFEYCYCEDSKTRWTTTEQDERNLERLYNAEWLAISN